MAHNCRLVRGVQLSLEAFFDFLNIKDASFECSAKKERKENTQPALESYRRASSSVSCVHATVGHVWCVDRLVVVCVCVYVFLVTLDACSSCIYVTD